MRVLALESGFYHDRRVRPGTEFDFDIEKFGNIPFKKDKNGNFVRDAKGVRVRDESAPRELPKWVTPATVENRQLLAKRMDEAADRAHDAAITASGGKIKKPNAEEKWLDAMRGDGPVTPVPGAPDPALAKARKQRFEEALGAGRGPSTPIA